VEIGAGELRLTPRSPSGRHLVASKRKSRTMAVKIAQTPVESGRKTCCGRCDKQSHDDSCRYESPIAGRPQRDAVGGDTGRIMDRLGRRRRQSGRPSRPGSCRRARAAGSGGMSSRPAAARRKVSPPCHWRDREWRSLARTNPAGRGKPACVYENVRFATTVGDLQGDVFIRRSTLERFPTIAFRRRWHFTFPIQSSGRS
jgi:hypothetical protein